MSHRFARCGVALTIIVAVPVSIVVYLCYTRFYRYQSEVDRIVRAIPAEDRALSREARAVFEKLDGEGMTWIATRYLLYELGLSHVRMGEWHLRGGIWQILLPTRLDRSEITAIYTHCMHSNSERGISALSKAMYGKRPSELTTSEAIGLVAIFRQPSATPTSHPERFRENVQRLTQRYRRGDG